jgi:hypothetical protein
MSEVISYATAGKAEESLNIIRRRNLGAGTSVKVYVKCECSRVVKHSRGLTWARPQRVNVLCLHVHLKREQRK